MPAHHPDRAARAARPAASHLRVLAAAALAVVVALPPTAATAGTPTAPRTAPGTAAAAPGTAAADDVAAAHGWRLVGGRGTTVLRTRGVAPAVQQEPDRRAAAEPAPTAVFLVQGTGLEPDVQAAVERATGVLSRTLSTGVPVRVVVAREALPEGVVATAAPGQYAVRDRKGADDRTDTLYPIALANALAGRDLDPAGPDVRLVLSNTAPLWTGEGPAPADRVDLASAALRQLVTAVGLLTTLRTEDGRGRWGVPGDAVDTPLVADRLVVNAGATDAPRSAPLLQRPSGSTALATALAAPLYWDGPAARAVAGGRRPLLVAPTGGLDGVRLPEDAAPPGSPDALLTPALAAGETVRSLGPVTLGMLSDVGWGVPSLPGARFTAVVPRRLLDTRTGLGQGGVRRTLGPGGVLDLQVAGGDTGVPADALSVVLNVTGVAPSRATDLRVYPTPRTPETVPETSSVNLGRGTTRAAAVTVGVGRDGRVRLRNAGGTVSVLVDLQGWYGTAGESLFFPVAPVRLLDTRDRAPARLGAGQWLDLQVAGVGRVPAGASAAVLTVTGVGATARSDVRVYPTPVRPGPVPVVSTVNLRPGPPVAGLTVVRLGAAGRVRLRNAAGSTGLLVDLAGWYAPTGNGGLGFRSVAPQRVFDSRRTSRPRLGPGGAVEVPVTGRGGIPAAAGAVVLGLTGISASRSTDLRVYPAPSIPGPPPVVSNLNLAPSQTSAAAAVVRTGQAGQVRVRNQSGTVGAAVDVTGWFGP